MVGSNRNNTARSLGGNLLFSLSMKVLSLLGMLTALQLLSIITSVKYMKKYFNGTETGEDQFMQHLWQINTQHHDHDYPCFPPWHTRFNRTTANNNQTALAVTTVYLETGWFDMHSETFYSFIHHLCSCSKQKSPHWMLRADVVPLFYVGPTDFISDGLKKVLTEFNRTSCGPIFVGSPTKPADLTIITTSYAMSFNDKNDGDGNYLGMVNDTSKIFICHESVPTVEGDHAKNVFWLTPRHSRYIVPTFFPPTIVEKSKERLRRNPNKVPIFLVLGSFNSDKRNVASLKAALEAHRGRKFIVRFLGGQSEKSKNESLVKFVNDSFPDDSSKIQLMPNFDTFTFMSQVGEVDAVLPLVDETNFQTKYQEGRKLTSSVSWALGFGKKMVIYKQLAEIFNIEEDNATYWQYDHSTSFSNAFGDCLNELEQPEKGEGEEGVNKMEDKGETHSHSSVKFRNPNMSICYYDSLNFGDELGPVVAKRLLQNHFGCSAASLPVLNLFSGDRVKEEDTTCLFVLGSVFHMVKEGDHVWGIGVNPSHFRAGTLPKSLTLHSVRGPLTSNFIKKEGFNSTKNNSLPLGDPGVLLPSLFGLAKSHGAVADNNTRVCFVVHKNDLGHTFVRKPPSNVHIITCAQHWETAVNEIQSCGFVASSSLHGIVVADALSIPRLWFQFNDTSTIRTEGNFKYQDYLQSIGHMNARPVRNVTFIEDTTQYSNALTQSELQAIINQTSASFPYHLFHT